MDFMWVVLVDIGCVSCGYCTIGPIKMYDDGLKWFSCICLKIWSTGLQYISPPLSRAPLPVHVTSKTCVTVHNAVCNIIWEENSYQNFGECHQNLSNWRKIKITSQTSCWSSVGQVSKIFSIVKVEDDLHACMQRHVRKSDLLTNILLAVYQIS